VRALRWPPAFTERVFHPVGIVRTILWLTLAAWLARALIREARRPAAPGRDPLARAPLQ
jgi:hypothetical protein